MWLIQRPGSEEVNREFRAGAKGKGETMRDGAAQWAEVTNGRALWATVRSLWVEGSEPGMIGSDLNF